MNHRKAVGKDQTNLTFQQNFYISPLAFPRAVRFCCEGILKRALRHQNAVDQQKEGSVVSNEAIHSFYQQHMNDAGHIFKKHICSRNDDATQLIF